ncbi:hypothetical protein J2S57_001803 [Kineosporia succinea]|uniref:Uncharacterized protein n=1 Tax=Kineosporia succinea TaxID=84632 RepID=A0ABT9P058_9ACTN|nr:hypothetical protein [Kineosporia succinea]
MNEYTGSEGVLSASPAGESYSQVVPSAGSAPVSM